MQNLKILFLFGLCCSLRIAKAEQSDFFSLCQVTLLGKDASICQKLNALLFPSGAKTGLYPLDPKQLAAPSMQLDSKIQFIVFNDPNYLPAVAYCYFVYRQWIDPSQISPDALGVGSSGFSILKESIQEYHRWLDYEPAGKNCKSRVQKESGLPVFDLKATLKDSIALVAINPYASIRSFGSNYAEVMQDMLVTLNHERIHAFQAQCPEFDSWGKQQWIKLADPEKIKMSQRYSSYNWNDLAVAGREYVAFTYEANPQAVLTHLGKCRN